ncbi:MAG TPA: hypothetical protein VG099_03770 [Gemmataceae bacterium]|jgi:hypothetical protein|nr:hypothetical protein [Gemmataceae bacterium]
MKREDYERMGPPKSVPVFQVREITECHLEHIVSLAQGRDMRKPPDAFGIVLKNGPDRYVAVLGKDETDQIIRALIACRNMLWPEA